MKSDRQLRNLLLQRITSTNEKLHRYALDLCLDRIADDERTAAAI